MIDSQPTYDIWRLLSVPRHEAEAEVRAACRTVYLGDNEALTRILGRYKMYVDTRDIGISSHLMMEGYWEMWVTEAMMRLLRRGAVVADVGANLGYFTLLMADLTGAEGHVLSFEPNPELAQRVRKSIEINGFAGFTDFYASGLGGEEGWAEMDVSTHQPGGGRTIPIKAESEPKAELEPEPDPLPNPIGLGEAIRRVFRPAPLPPVALPEPENGPEIDKNTPPSSNAVKILRFDELPRSREVEFMKIDVEGFEPHVWSGMTGRLENYDLALTIFMEFTICRLDDPHGFLQEILDWGFSLEIIDFNKGVLPITPEQLFAGPHDIDHMLVFRREARIAEEHPPQDEAGAKIGAKIGPKNGPKNGENM